MLSGAGAVSRKYGGKMFLPTFGTDAVTEVSLRIGRNEHFHPLPVAGVIPDFFAIRANRQ